MERDLINMDVLCKKDSSASIYSICDTFFSTVGLSATCLL